MDEIKPVVFWECPLCTHLYLVRVSECDCQSGAKTFRKVKLYDQQAIDTLRAEIERQKELISDLNSIIRGIPAELRRASQAKQELSDFLIARAERAEAEADALRKDAERYRWLRQNEDWTLDGIVRWQEGYEPINASHEVLDAAIDIARQEKQ